MEETNVKKPSKESNLLSLLLFRFLPYWPLFAFLILICAAGAWIYLRNSTPIYRISATVLLKDEKKGVDDSKLVEFLNISTSKKIVENEIEVIRSRTIMKEVVNRLHLYAPVWEERYLKPASAFSSSPIIVEAKDPELLRDFRKIYYSFTIDKKVRIGNLSYPLDQWEPTPYGILRFRENPNIRTRAQSLFYFSLIPQKIVVNSLLGKLDADPTSKLSTVINLQLTDEIPERGEQILNEIILAYNRAAINDKNALAANTLSFVEDRMKIVESGLDSIEKKIQQYKSQRGAVDLSTQGKLILENVGNNDRTLADIGMQLAVLEQVEKYVISKDQKAGIVPSTLGVNDQILSQLLQKLYESELKYENLKQTVGDNNTVLISLRREIEQLRPNILENIRNQRKNLQASRTNLSNTNTGVSSLLRTIPQKERELLEISREQSIKNNVYAFLLQKQEETALSYASTVPDSRIVDQAESSITPVGPKRSIIYYFAFAIAIGLGVAVVIGKEFLSGKILFRSDIENYSKVAIVAEISNVKHKQELVIDQPKNVFIAEQFRQLRAAIGLYGKTTSKKKLLITSSLAGEGKSFVAANLALSLAGSGKKVVLLDIDLRSPKTSSIFTYSNEKGMAEYLQGEIAPSEIIKTTKYPNLYIVPAGIVSINPTELLLMGDLNQLFTYLDESFNYILVDTSPVDAVTDAYVLSEYCDKTLFVIRHGVTPKTMIQLLDESNKTKALRDLSIVFNGIKKRGFIKGGYGFGYGFGYEHVYKETKEIKRTAKPNIS